MHTENLNFFAQLAETLDAAEYAGQKPECWDISRVVDFESQSMEMPFEYLQKKKLQQNNHALPNTAPDREYALSLADARSLTLLHP